MEDGMPGKAGSRGSLVERRQRAEIQELKVALAEATVQLRICRRARSTSSWSLGLHAQVRRPAAELPVARFAALAWDSGAHLPPPPGHATKRRRAGEGAVADACR